ncbi:toxin-antitoxin system YwqK family antitoxin [Polaribacter glomeratus]|uniref:Antitoxin component YwqK of the YwqJK toxin-antitoxin module n=1 Tax=Polaribacter glomeratus TaxID=102 RepID=A0A2S7WXN9_9FLAO|nr:toxin-antitoxin system YwqK family antitoxin [Polaribacter glomeratus]PQJ82181.1 hypothetical protein BTO16_06150 [Polaribacter glomeratus]TXD66775.1 toxin-antitoxin system YwqK family antitoxin [Polaribacter glomeratus]
MKANRIILVLFIFYIQSLNAQVEKIHFENGNIKEIGEYDSTGKAIGEWKHYHENGQLESIGKYENGEAIGEWKFYYKNGQLERVGKFENKIATGKWTFYFDNGKLKSIGNLENGQVVGEWKFYYKNGQLKMIGKYANVKPAGEWKFYHENGQLSSIGKMENGIVIGDWKHYYENGQLEKIENLKNGKLMYISSYFDVNGTALNQETLQNGNGFVNEYYQGLLINKIEYINGEMKEDTFSILPFWDNAYYLNSFAWGVYEKTNSTTTELNNAIIWVKRAIKLNKDSYNTDTYAALLYKTGFYTLALEMAEESLVLGKKEKLDITATEKLIEKIKEKQDAGSSLSFIGMEYIDAFMLQPKIEEFNGGKRDPDFLYDLSINAIRVNKKDASDYVKAYYKTQKNLMTAKTIDLMYQYIENPLSDEFIFLQKNEVEAEKLYQENSISDKLDLVVLEYAITVNKENQPKTITTQNMVLAVEKTILKFRPQKAFELKNRFGMQISTDTNDHALFEKYTLAYLDKNYKNQSMGFLNDTAWRFFEHSINIESLEKALKWAIESVSKSSNFHNNDTVANLYYKLGDKNNARIYAEIAIKLGKVTGKNTTTTELLFQKLK